MNEGELIGVVCILQIFSLQNFIDKTFFACRILFIEKHLRHVHHKSVYIFSQHANKVIEERFHFIQYGAWLTQIAELL